MLKINLIKKRQEKGFTQTQVAEKIGVTERHYQALEAGTSNGSIELWLKLKDLLGETLDFLLEQEV